MIHRRELLALSGAPLAGAALGIDRVAARSAPKTSQVPGFYRFNLGKYQVTVVSDGSIIFPRGALAEPPKEARIVAWRRTHRDEIAVQMNALVVNTGDKLVLIDAGTSESCGRVRDGCWRT